MVALPTAAGILLAVSPLVRKLVAQRFFAVVEIAMGTGFSRLVMWRAFLDDVWSSPLFGHGAAAYREISEQLGIQGTVSENFVIEILHAGGAVSLILLVVAMLGIMLDCLMQPGASRRPAQTAACLAGAVALILGSMTNPAAWNGLFWVLMGVVACRPLAAEVVAPGSAYSVKRPVHTVSTRNAAAPSTGG